MIAKDFFERIQTQYANTLPFVAYRKPKKATVNVLLQNTDALYYANDFTEKGFIFSPFDDKEKTVLIPKDSSELISCSSFSEETNKEEAYSNHTPSTKSKDFHVKLIKKGVEAIENNEFKKVVLSRSEHVVLSEINLIDIFKNLLDVYPSAFVYCWYHPKVGLWLGATPETLVKIEGSRFSIMALAGTQDYKGTLDVSWQDKEQQEQQLVTDFITDSLKPSVTRLNVSNVETVKAGNLLHLKTMISAQLKSDITLKQIISALHPTPAVCGLPKDEAKAFILTHEGYNREFYTGFLGELNLESTAAPRSGRRNIENRAYAFNKKSTQLYVNLRCMQLQSNEAIIYVGGGITKNSNADSEWEETVSKSMVIKKVL